MSAIDSLREFLVKRRIERVIEYRWKDRDYVKVYARDDETWEGPATQEVLKMIDETKSRQRI